VTVADASFFDESTEQSQVKSAIVSKYFWAWAQVMISTARKYPQRSSSRIAYIDLFCGPGEYADGAPSTPLKVLAQAVADPRLRQMLVTIFNDKDGAACETLRQAIQDLPGIKSLRYAPEIWNEDVGENLARRFKQINFVPTLFFVDPWGYKGLSLELINSVLKDWGCDSIFFFNYNRVSMGLANPAVKAHMDALFGPPRAQTLREQVAVLPSQERELAVVEALSQALKAGGRYVLPFRFKNASGGRTSHYIVFVSKAERGYILMKDVMANESSHSNQGVPTFEYAPAPPQRRLLFEMSRPLDTLADELLQRYAGQSLSVEQVFLRHHVDTPYVSKNYKAALLELERQGKIQVRATTGTRRKGTMADHLIVSFPDLSSAQNA
jgi:three-Cys-motif partner protein